MPGQEGGCGDIQEGEARRLGDADEEGGQGVDRPARRPADGQGDSDVRRFEVSQPQALRMGRRACEVGPDHRPPPRGQERLGEAADPVDGGADLRMAGSMPAAEQGPGEECPVVGVVRRAGDDPADAQPARTVGDGPRVPLPQGGPIELMGQTLGLASKTCWMSDRLDRWSAPSGLPVAVSTRPTVPSLLVETATLPLGRTKL